MPAPDPLWFFIVPLVFAWLLVAAWSYNHNHHP